MNTRTGLAFVTLSLFLFTLGCGGDSNGRSSVSTTYDTLLLDGLDGWLLSLAPSDNTIYASGFSDSAFRRIQPGMTEADVLRVCGEPLARLPADDTPGRSAWVYSYFRKKGDYHERDVAFQNGRVAFRWSDFWVD